MEATGQERGELLWLVHWPGKSVYACERHRKGLENLARAMGFAVESALALEPAVCANCEREARGQPPRA